MPDYIYLLENRLSADQQAALRLMREAAREAEMILFLTGEAVRDLTSGHAVRDLEVAVHGNALKLKKTLEKSGAKIWGEDAAAKTLYLCFPGTVRVDLVSTHRVEYPKPGQPVYHAASIQEDLRRRDFTANAMAISLNEGSFGLLMDPLNGVADIEARLLRVVSNYGFIEEPSLLIRATRFKTRLGWELEPRTQTRYENARGDGAIEYLSETARSRELEQIGHEDDGLRVLQALEAEGWMKVLFPQWTAAKADEDRLKALHDLTVELLMQGVHADTSAAQMQLLTAKLSSKDLLALKKVMLRPGFVEEWNSLDSLAAGFAKVLLAKENQTPSVLYRLFTTYDPEAVLWLAFTTKDNGVKERFNNFLKVWPETRQKVPYGLMQEMRIKPEMPIYNDLAQAIFLELIDGKLTTVEEMKAFLEPHSPPAPPPQVSIKRSRTKRSEAKAKESFDEDEEDSEDSGEGDEDLDDMGADEEEIELELPKIDLDEGEAGEVAGELDGEDELEEEGGEEEGSEEEEPAPKPRGRAAKTPKTEPAAKAAPAPKPEKVAAAKAEPAPAPAEKHAAKAAGAPAVAHAPASKEAKPAAKSVPHGKPHAPAKVAQKPSPAAKTPAKKAAQKPAPKPAAKIVKPAQAKVKHAPAKPGKAKPKPPAKPAPKKKPAAKPAKKH